MNDLSLKAILESAAAWPEEDRRELADFARVIEARRKGVYVTDESERQALSEALEEADSGGFATDAEVAEASKRVRA